METTDTNSTKEMNKDAVKKNPEKKPSWGKARNELHWLSEEDHIKRASRLAKNSSGNVGKDPKYWRDNITEDELNVAETYKFRDPKGYSETKKANDQKRREYLLKQGNRAKTPFSDMRIEYMKSRGKDVSGEYVKK